MADPVAEIVQYSAESAFDIHFNGKYPVKVVHDVVVNYQGKKILIAAFKKKDAKREHPKNGYNICRVIVNDFFRQLQHMYSHNSERHRTFRNN